MMAWWLRLRSYFTRYDPPGVRLANVILIRAMKEHASIIYIDCENGVRIKVGGETKVMMGPPEEDREDREDREAWDRIYELTKERLRWMARTDARSGTILLSVAEVGPARLELRPYGREGLVITIEENPYVER